MKVLKYSIYLPLLLNSCLATAQDNNSSTLQLSEETFTRVDEYLKYQFIKAISRSGDFFKNTSGVTFKLIDAKFFKDSYRHIDYYATIEVKAFPELKRVIKIPTYKDEDKIITDVLEAHFNSGTTVILPMKGSLRTTNSSGQKYIYNGSMPFGGYYLSTHHSNSSDLLISQHMFKILLSGGMATLKPMRYEDAISYINDFTDGL